MIWKIERLEDGKWEHDGTLKAENIRVACTMLAVSVHLRNQDLNDYRIKA